MNWLGKIIGVFFGFLFGGYFGALIGLYIGHKFDTGLAQDFGNAVPLSGSAQQKIQVIFFTSTFSVMGHLAKADGVVTEKEINLANRIMDEMRLNEQMRQSARDLFAKGKSAGFQLTQTLQQLKSESRNRKNLLQMFLEIQIRAANADGSMDSSEHRILTQVANVFGFTNYELASLISRYQAHEQFEDFKQGHHSSSAMLKNAYAVLGLPENSSEAEVKRAYRRLMSQHHPDKLVAKGLPETMLQMAKEKTQEIKSAYDLIKKRKQ